MTLALQGEQESLKETVPSQRVPVVEDSGFCMAVDVRSPFCFNRKAR